MIKAAKRIFNSDKICRSYSDLNFGVTFFEHSVESLQLRKHCNCESIATQRPPDIAPVVLAYYQHFLVFLFENNVFSHVLGSCA